MNPFYFESDSFILLHQITIKRTSMKRLHLLIILLGFTFSTMAQEQSIVQGYCKDENGKAIENVSVYAHDSLLVSVTDEQGRFTYGHAEPGEKLRFAHMVFEPTYYTINKKDINGKNLTVRMKTKNHELLEVQVTANAPHIAFDNPVMTVIDYTLRDDGIYLIAYRRRNSTLLHLSFDMDTLHEMKISSRYKYISKDAFGDIYAINDYQASLVGFMELENGKKLLMNFYHSMSRKEFYDKFAAIVAASDSIFVTGQRHFFNTGLGYYRHIYGRDEEPKLLHYIEDDEAAGSIRFTKGHYEVQSEYIEPVYAPIFAVDNKFYIFAYIDHETVVFDAAGNELERYPLTFHEYRKWNGKMVPDRRWKHKMLMDAARKEFYTFFVNDGLCTLKRIDLQTGIASAVMDLSGYPFAENMRIHDGVLYFLYPTGFNHRRALYQVKIE